jgi:hypothetical protein
MNKNSIMLMQKINSIEVLNDFKICETIAPGYFDESTLPVIVCIQPMHTADFIEVDKIGYLRINQILWKIEEHRSFVDSQTSLSYYEFTLSKVQQPN